jgi:coenzyme Q-binding protein COQ10
MNLPYRPEDLFDLVSDVGRYPEFIKWIRSIKCIQEHEEGPNFRCRAEATVGFQGFAETFVTDVDARSSDLAIDVNLVRGPFRKLTNSWRFTAVESGTRVDFSIRFEFKSFILQTLADANKAFAIRRIIDAFTEEAGRRYTRVSAPV